MRLPIQRKERIEVRGEWGTDGETIPIEARKGLEPLVGKPVKPLLATFRRNTGDVHFWTIMNVLKEAQNEVLHF